MGILKFAAGLSSAAHHTYLPAKNETIIKRKFPANVVVTGYQNVNFGYNLPFNVNKFIMSSDFFSLRFVKFNLIVTSVTKFTWSADFCDDSELKSFRHLRTLQSFSAINGLQSRCEG